MLAVMLVLPLVTAEIPVGFRVASSDLVLSVISAAEGPLSTRSPLAIWLALVLAGWFVVWARQRGPWWEAALVVAASAIALVRVGNAWVAAIVLIVPLARRASTCSVPWLWSRRGLSALAFVCVVAAVVVPLATRPRDMPAGVVTTGLAAARASAANGPVLAHWAWAPAVQSALGSERVVVGAKGLAGESGDVWLDYLRLVQGHQRWQAILDSWGVDLLVLDAADQDRKAADLVRGSTRWRVIYEGDGALVAERRTP